MRGSPALALYLGLSRLLEWPVRLLLRQRLSRGKEDPERIGERSGHPGVARPAGRVVWLHGASVGEAMSILPLVDAISRSDPKITCLVTTGTVTSAERMAVMLPEGAIHQFVPVDTGGAIKRFLDHWRPDLAVWVESEFWPGLVVETGARDIPMALVNARVSEESARNWGWAPGMIRAMLGSFSLLVCQDASSAGRITALRGSSDGVRICGNLKALAPLPKPSADHLAKARAAIADRPVWLAASTHPGEEEIVLDAQLSLDPKTLLILAPRHPERAEEVASLCAARGHAIARASAGEVPEGSTTVWLGDMLGQMGLWLRLAPVAFIGGSLAEMGGHTPFEPAMLDVAILHGPHVANFAPAYADLANVSGAETVVDAESLAAGVTRLHSDPEVRAEMARKARILFSDAPDPDALADELLGIAEPS